MKNAFAIVTLSALVSACAVVPPQQPAQEAAAPAAAEPTPAAEAIAKAVPPGEKLPNVELTSELFYKLTKAELDFKRGQWQSAYVAMMVLAQQTRDPRLARRASEMALSAKQGNEALAAIRLWRELAPDSDEAAQYFLGFAVLGDDLGEAEQLFAQRLKSAAPTGRPLLMFQMQQFLLRAKDKAGAFALMERVLQPYLKTQEAHLVLAQGANAAGQADRARAEAQKAVEIKPDSELAILTMGQMLQDLDGAQQLFAGFLQKYPAAREVRSAYARLLVEQKQYDKAREQFELLLKDQPDNPGTLYALGIMSLQGQDSKAAEDYFKRYIAVLESQPDPERDPNKALMLLAQIAEERGDLDAALGWLEKIEAEDPRATLSARLKRAHITARKGDVDGARAQLKEITPADLAEQVQIVQTEGQLLRDAGRAVEAFKTLEDGVLRYPNSPDLMYDYALAAEKLGKVDAMETALRKVMESVPDNHHAYNALGYSLADRNIRLDEAYELIDKALKMAPGDPYIMDSMGWVLFRMGKLKEAEQSLRQAYALRGDAEIAVHLGEVLWTQGDKAGAAKLWREARAKDPKNDALRSTLARLNAGI
ncbi:tetratricopeptide repeat protein [Pseudoduganella sp. DS3]|uniref:Tetratricopeptide repeat protein n=1 Tax=Pseudoduganella guangdongensis TaxID=2692179 RepID=A0A6N9HHQ4_9BURK|nr:tetratricopeptide repeat protein [Pseudoduganella guangdongensis]MYN02807.1 tetratricopeptide repeat protein [Pseudoduganella guangdongensis]